MIGGRSGIGRGLGMRTVLAPGSFAWLLRHELRLALRGTRTRASWVARNLPLLILATVPTIGGVALAFVFAASSRHGGRPVTGRALDTLLGFTGFGIAALLVLMISTASIAVLRTFHDRHDLDLLLSAPMPAARVLAAKCVGVALTVAAPFWLFAGPFTVTLAVLGQPRWLGGLAMIGVDATVATAIALGLTSVLFNAIGARRARTVVQLGAAVMGAAAFLLSQLRSVSPKLAHHLFRAAARRWPAPFDWPARAALGEVLPLLAMAALAGGAAWGASRFGARHLSASSDTGDRVTRSRSGPVRFQSGVARIVVTKELRLIGRDPELIGQIALRLIYVIPLGGLLLRGGHGVDPGPAIAGAATAAAGLLAASLGWIVVCAEDAPDLLAAAPVPAARIARAKLIAACLAPVAVVVVAALAVAARGAAWPAAVTLVLGVTAATTGALLQAWFGKPQPRSAFRRRQSGSFVVGLGEVALAGAWSGTAALLARGSIWALAPALLSGAIMAGAIEARGKE